MSVIVGCRLLLWGEMFWFRRRIAESDLRI